MKFSLSLLALAACAVGSPAQNRVVCANGRCQIQTSRVAQPSAVQSSAGTITFTDGSVGVWNAQARAYVIQPAATVQAAPKAAPATGGCNCENCPANAGKPAPGVVGAVQQEGGLFGGTLRKAIILDSLRSRAEFDMIRNGVKRPDGSVVKVTRAQARDLVSRVSDDTIFGGAKALGAPSTGALQDFLKWVWDNKDAIVKFILSIVALFSDDIPNV